MSVSVRKTEHMCIRFFADASDGSKKAEELLLKAEVPFVKVECPLGTVTTPAIEYRGLFFEGIAEIATAVSRHPERS